MKLPLDKKTDRLSNAILMLDPENATGGRVGGEERQEEDSGAQRSPVTLPVVAELERDAEVVLAEARIASCRSSFDGDVTRT